MDDREWMYTGWTGKKQFTDDFTWKVNDFLEKAFHKGQSRAPCPFRKCENKTLLKKIDIGKHICINGFMPNYTRWICHGEAHRAREEVMRRRIDDFDAGAGCGDMLDDFHEAHFAEGPSHVREEEEPEATAKGLL